MIVYRKIMFFPDMAKENILIRSQIIQKCKTNKKISNNDPRSWKKTLLKSQQVRVDVMMTMMEHPPVRNDNNAWRQTTACDRRASDSERRSPVVVVVVVVVVWRKLMERLFKRMTDVERTKRLPTKKYVDVWSTLWPQPIISISFGRKNLEQRLNK